MDEIQQGLRYLFQTTSPYVLLVQSSCLSIKLPLAGHVWNVITVQLLRLHSVTPQVTFPRSSDQLELLGLAPSHRCLTFKGFCA